MRGALIALIAGAITIAPAMAAERGGLVIVGGGLDPENAAIFDAFLELRPVATQSIVIIPAASGSPAISAQRFRDDLVRHGADPATISIVHLAVEDDPGTPQVDESAWSKNAANAAEIAKIEAAGAIWFTGGDQSRITRALLAQDGRATPMLSVIHQRHTQGAVIGGTSAGAAIMSDPMIAQGDTMKALGVTDQGEELQLVQGLGFLPNVIVDQHFGERARLGRLAVAITERGHAARIGIGIDEDTALVWSPDKSVHVVGSAYVTLLDAQQAERRDEGRLSIAGLRVGMAGPGDRIDLSDATVTPAEYRNTTVGNEYFESPSQSGGGMALAGNRLEQVIGEALIDNSASNRIERHSFVEGRGITYRFSQTDRSQGWWGRPDGGTAHYSIDSVTFDVLPIDVHIQSKETP